MNPSRPIAAALLVAGFALIAAAPADKAEPGDKKEAILRLLMAEFVPITPGKDKFPATFRMGSSGDGALAEEKPEREVTMAAPFAMAKYEVTQELYQAIIGKNPSRWKGPRNSVEMTNWNEAVDFCEKAADELRRRKLLGDDEVIRLPSEAEWEYCCRAGSTTPYGFGDKVEDLKAHAWFKENSKGEDPPVGKKKPNAWGLYDMHGYIWEWVQDSWHPSYEKAPKDGSAWEEKDAKERVARGGSWADAAERCRSAARLHPAADHRSDTIGFRCVRAKKEKSK
jgi:formylglycine-generating enzyme required for sulfatase activity